MPNQIISEQNLSNLTPTQTNQAWFQFDLAAINQDFKFLRLERDNGNWFGAPTLDKALQDFPVKAVLYSYGKFAFMMFDASQNIEKIKHQLLNNERLQDVKIKTVQAIEPPDDFTRPGIYDKWLMQIFLNSLVAERASDQEPISNLGGGFYWLLKQTESKLLTLKIEINYQGMLSLQAKHFVKQSEGYLNEKPQYIIENSRYLKRVFGDEIKQQKLATYIEEGFKFKGQAQKASIPFLAIKDKIAFEASKLGIWQQIHQRIESRLSRYLTLSFTSLPMKHQRTLAKATTLRNRVKNLNCKKITLVDEVKTNASQQAINEIHSLLSAQPGLVVQHADHSQPEQLNIRLVYDAAYYQQQAVPDPYKSANEQHAIQHLILQTWQESQQQNVREAILQMCLKEAQLKRDILQQQLTSFDWVNYAKQHDLDQDVYFLKIVYPDRKGRGSTAIKKEHISLTYIKVEPSGRLTQGHIHTQENLFATNQTERDHQAWLELAREYRTERNAKSYWLGNLTYLMIIGEQALGFYNSDMWVLPYYSKIAKRLEQIQQPLPAGWQTPQDWLEKFHQFKQQSPGLVADAEQHQRLQNLEQLLQQQTDDAVLTRKSINKLISEGLNPRTTAYDCFDQYLMQQGIYLRFSKGGTHLDVYTPGLVKLNTYQRSNALGYSVGIPAGNLQSKFERGTKIRWIRSLNNQPIDIEKTSQQLADLLDVDFIQAKQSGTVWPFVFAFLNE